MGTTAQGKSDGSNESLQRILGYLNFSSGAVDTQFLEALNEFFRERSGSRSKKPTWLRVCTELQKSLKKLEKESAAFADARQARLVLELIQEFLPAYKAHHPDLLAHQSDELLFNSLFVGRAFEMLLSLNVTASDDQPKLLEQAITRLNDYIGYRPVATLESQKVEPYAHEWVRPIPLYVSGAGPASTRYASLIEMCVELLHATETQLLRAAYFDPGRMDELALDPRAYDFEHPANKRPNHHFGQWDPNLIDGDGFYRRFVVQQVTIDCLLQRVDDAKSAKGIPSEELMFEAAAVLAGTILMASGISGYGPETHHSDVTLSSLLVKIAAYRDAFYDRLLGRVKGTHGARLRNEAEQLQQPFAGARQDLNRRLTASRAIQMQRVHLAKNYARMGYRDAAEEQADLIQVPSARLMTQIDCKLTEARTCLRTGDLPLCVAALNTAREILLRAVDCGAAVDPWNILGFDGNFSVFGSIENSLRDYRIDDMVELVEEMLELYARLWSKAAASEQTELAQQTSASFKAFANWWHQFAAHELDSVGAENPLNVYEAAKSVSAAIEAWHNQGEATGDIGFWAPHVQDFDSCRAYWLVIDTLLSRDDKVATLGLLMHWLSQADEIPLDQGETSFFRLSLHWLSATLEETGRITNEPEKTGWSRVRRFYDYLEANVGEFGQVPEFSPDVATPTDEEVAGNAGDENQDAEADDELYSAAYESVVFRDSTDDGMEGNIFDFDSHDEDYLQQMSRPIVERLSFVEQLATSWKLTSVAWATSDAQDEPDVAAARQSIVEMLGGASRYLAGISRDLRGLADSVSSYRLTRPSGDPDSMVNYDRLRLLKDSLLDQIINTHVHVIESQQFLLASIGVELADSEAVGLREEELAAVGLLRAALRGDTDAARSVWREVSELLLSLPILYLPLGRGGKPRAIIDVKARQQLIQNLLFWFPRIGLIKETYELIESLREMERRNVVGMGAVTEFDDLFEVGCVGIVTALIDAAKSADINDTEEWLGNNFEDFMEPLLHTWLSHSRTLRLSVLEQVMDEENWTDLSGFIVEFGRDLFTQRFLSLGNIRGILHQGVDVWLATMREYGGDDEYQPLLDALDHDLPIEDAVDMLTLILEAIVENYSEYRDYNSITTQSDRGDLLYTLLDFLRLRISYDRIVWNLRPFVLAHQVFAVRGCEGAAETWRRKMQQKIQGEADRHFKRLLDLQKQYAMHLPSISKRVSERFMRPLMIDYLCSLIAPAMHDSDESVRTTAFEGIQAQADIFMDEPSGAGLDAPAWLLAMEDTVLSLKDEQETSLHQSLDHRIIPSRKLGLEELQDQLLKWQSKDATDAEDDVDDD